MNHSAENATSEEELSQETPLTTSAEIPMTMGETTSKHSAKPVMTKRRAKKLDSEALMTHYGAWWGNDRGRKVLNFPSHVTQEARNQILEAIRSEG